jgi:hypothetical protein
MTLVCQNAPKLIQEQRRAMLEAESSSSDSDSSDSDSDSDSSDSDSSVPGLDVVLSGQFLCLVPITLMITWRRGIRKSAC